jgi:hypothetical protein
MRQQTNINNSLDFRQRKTSGGPSGLIIAFNCQESLPKTTIVQLAHFNQNFIVFT